MENVSIFEAGRTYYTRSICDHNCIVEYTIVKRTAKFATLIDNGNTKRVGISVHNGAEIIFPNGKYSMCPIISADSPTIRPLTDWEKECVQ